MEEAEATLDRMLAEASDILMDMAEAELDGRIALRFSYEQQHGHSMEEQVPFLLL